MGVEQDSAVTSAYEVPAETSNLHVVQRGQLLDIDFDDSITGFAADRMRARALLTYEEEKKLLRRIDWHIMPLCAIMFLLKNLDSSNVSLPFFASTYDLS